MKNPWKDFIAQKGRSKFHDLDRPHIMAFNHFMKGRKAYLLAEHLEPHPYFGNPEAPVVVLLANPGKNAQESSPKFRLSKTQKKISQENLLHRGDFVLRYDSVDKSLESRWLKSMTRELRMDSSDKEVAENVFFLNFHGYHSKSWSPIPFTFETQRYNFYLLRKAIERNAIILMKRNVKGWFTAVPELVNHKKRYEFKSPRGVHITERNLPPGVYSKVLKTFE